MYRQSYTMADERVRSARAASAELARLTAIRDGLAAELVEVEQEIARLSTLVVSEDADVKRFQRGLWAFLYDVVADREARLSKEQAEAAAAHLKYQEALGRHGRLREAMADVVARLAPLAGADEALAEAQAAKLDELIDRGGPAAERLVDLDEEAAKVRAWLVAVDEAIAAGRGVLSTLTRVAKLFADADRTTGLDLIMGADGAHRARRDRADRARGLAGVAQAELTMFKRELADVGMQVHTAPLATLRADHHLVDRWVDNLLTDVVLTTGVGLAHDATAQVIGEVERALAALAAHRASLEARGQAIDASLLELTEPPTPPAT